MSAGFGVAFGRGSLDAGSGLVVREALATAPKSAVGTERLSSADEGPSLGVFRLESRMRETAISGAVRPSFGVSRLSIGSVELVFGGGAGEAAELERVSERCPKAPDKVAISVTFCHSFIPRCQAKASELTLPALS